MTEYEAALTTVAISAMAPDTTNTLNMVIGGVENSTLILVVPTYQGGPLVKAPTT